MEIISRSALMTYSKERARCRIKVNHTGMGEDMWLQECLELLEIGSVWGQDIIHDSYCRGGVAVPENCIPGMVAFHPFKTANTWMLCWKHAGGKPSFWKGSGPVSRDRKP